MVKVIVHHTHVIQDDSALSIRKNRLHQRLRDTIRLSGKFLSQRNDTDSSEPLPRPIQFFHLSFYYSASQPPPLNRLSRPSRSSLQSLRGCLVLENEGARGCMQSSTLVLHGRNTQQHPPSSLFWYMPVYLVHPQ